MKRKRLIFLAAPLIGVILITLVVLRRTSPEIPTPAPSSHTQRVGRPVPDSQGQVVLAPLTSSGSDPAGATQVVEIQSSIAKLRAEIAHIEAPLVLIPLLVDLERHLSKASAEAQAEVERVLADSTQGEVLRALLAVVLGPRRTSTTEKALLSAATQGPELVALAAVISFASHPGKGDFDLRLTEQFWFEAFHALGFGSSLFPDFYESMWATKDFPASYRAWRARVGHVTEEPGLSASLDVVRRLSDSGLREDVFARVNPSGLLTAKFSSAVCSLYRDITDKTVRTRCLELLERGADESTTRFLEERAIAETDTDLKTAAVKSILRSSSTDVEGTLRRIYFTVPDESVRGAVLGFVHKSDTAGAHGFLTAVMAGERNPSLRTQAVTAIGFMEPRLHRQEKLSLLVLGLRDSVPEVRDAALVAIGRAKFTDLTSEVRRTAQQDQNQAVRSTAESVLGKLSSK